jgi:transketolase N-terminal domain/subunit
MTATRAILLKRLEAEALQIRRNVWRALHAAGSGHVGGSASAADLLAALYFHTLNVRPHEPDWSERDRFVLSKGHANAALAAVLAQAEFIEEALLDRFYGYESPLGMHPDIKVAGVEMSTGGLGHGLAVRTGMSLSWLVSSPWPTSGVPSAGKCERSMGMTWARSSTRWMPCRSIPRSPQHSLRIR